MKTRNIIGLGAVTALAVAIGFVVMQSRKTENAITAFESRIADSAAAAEGPVLDASRLAALPAPVQRYFAFVFAAPPKPYKLVRLSSEGMFRRPQTESFNPVTARQVIAVGAP